MGDELTREFVVTGPVDVVDRITALLATMSWLGGIGASREIKFGWDGDGHERFNLESGSIDTTEFVDPCQFVDDRDLCDEVGEKNMGQSISDVADLSVGERADIVTGDVVDTPAGPGRIDRTVVPCPTGTFPGEVGFVVSLQDGSVETFCQGDVVKRSVAANRAPTARSVIEGILGGVPVHEAVLSGIHSVQIGRKGQGEARYRVLIAEIENQGDVDANTSALQRAGATGIEVESTDFDDESTVVSFDHPDADLTRDKLEEFDVIADLLVRAESRMRKSEARVSGRDLFFIIGAGGQFDADDQIDDLVAKLTDRGLEVDTVEVAGDPQERGSFDIALTFTTPEQAQQAEALLDDLL